MSYTPYGTARFSLGSMQAGMDPCAFGTRIILGDVVSGLPIPAQSVPHAPEQWNGRRRRGTGLQTVKKGSDLCIHEYHPSETARAAGFALRSPRQPQASVRDED